MEMGNYITEKPKLVTGSYERRIHAADMFDMKIYIYVYNSSNEHSN